MSINKKAQKIVNEIDHELGIFLVQFQNSELEYLKNKLEEFLELDVSTDDLVDGDDCVAEEEDEEDRDEAEV